MELELREEPVENRDQRSAYSMYLFGMRSPVTRDTYLRRLRTFFNHIRLLSNDESMEVRCNQFAERAKSNQNWAFMKILEFLQYQRERVERKEITPATLLNFVKAIKLFCEMTEIEISWKRITRGLPKVKRYADDRAPTLEEIQKIAEYPDRRIKAIIYTMASSGIRLSAWDFLRWGHIKPIEKQGKVVAAKITVYAGDTEEYYTFITSEAYEELSKWMKFRRDAGEIINEKSWVMRWKWDTIKGHSRGLIHAPKKLEIIGIKRLINDALWTQRVRTKSQLKGRRYEFQADHGFRKWFKTRCELGGMKSINIETLMGHSIGISDSYYRITENELLEEYVKIQNVLTIEEKNQLQNRITKQSEMRDQDNYIIKGKLQEKDEDIKKLQLKDKMKDEVLANISDRLVKLTSELEALKTSKTS